MNDALEYLADLPTVRTLDDHARTELVAAGSMRGAHGQPDALRFGVLRDGTVLFHDTARGIYQSTTCGIVDDIADELEYFGTPDAATIARLARERITAAYIRGYAYDGNSAAGWL